MTSTLPTATRQWVLKSLLKDEAESMDHFSLISVPIPKESTVGKILVKVLFYSNDPAQRTWMDSGPINERPYLPPVMQEGAKVFSGAIGEVIESYRPGFFVGDLVFGHFGWAEYALVDPSFGDPVRKIPEGISPEDFLCMDLAGQTAYFAFFSRAGATKDLNTVVINSAAGGVGVMLVQFAKSILAISRVVAICGSDAKCKVLTETYSADVALNYKCPGFEHAFEEATPDYIDLYIDDVGGRLFDIGLKRIRPGGTIVVHGAISNYNQETPSTNLCASWPQMWCQRANVLGFLIVDYHARRSDAIAQIVQWVKDGRLQLPRTVSDVPFEQVPEVWQRLFQEGPGGVGKEIVKVLW